MKIIERSDIRDLERIMEIYREAQRIMVDSGNLHQWPEGHPSAEMIAADIRRGVNYSVFEDGGADGSSESGDEERCLVGAFNFIPGKDPTYSYIEGGQWLDADSPYATIHRVASTRGSHGVASAIFEWSWRQIPSLRVDTHKDNWIMRRCIEKAGFTYCGVIYLESGDPRLAYQKIGL